MGRRRSPPRHGRGGNYDMDRRRSRSPPDRYGRGPSPRRGRRDDPYERYDDGFRGRGPRGSPRYDEPFPFNEPRRGSPPPPERGPKTFKQFMLSQEDDPEPEEAQERYRRYLVEWHGGEIKAEFAQTRNEERVRALYDPRFFEKALAKRNEEAADSATRFREDLTSGALDPKAPGFNQGAFDRAPKPPTSDDDPKPTYAPPVCWRPARVAADLVLSRRLIRRLDWEKGFPSDNPLLPPPTEEQAQAQAEADAQEQKDAAALKEEGKDAPTGTAKRYTELPEEVPVVDDSNYEDSIGKLDQQLTYLWRVHGVDYYACYELNAAEFSQRLSACRLLRGAKEMEEAGGDSAMAVDGQQPKEGAEGGEGAGAGKEGTAAGGKGGEPGPEAVEAWVEKRIKEGDPLEAKCQRKLVERKLEEWVDDQILCLAENKWGNKLSTKLFVARKFVVKHIHTKHEEKVQAQKEQILDDLYWENFKAAKEEEARQHAEEGPDGHKRGGRGGRGGRGMGRGGMGPRDMMGGRGGGMNPLAGPMGPMMLPPEAAMNMMMGMGPVIMAPGMGPMMMAPMMGGMPLPMMAPPMMLAGPGGRGGRGGRGMGGGGRGRGRGGREYYDLDNPMNNRAVLDYGDL